MAVKREIVIIGGGPAGLAAAVEAAKHGSGVLVIDENRRPGGQLFKQIHKFFGSKAHNAGIRGYQIGKNLLESASEYGVEVWLDSPVIGIFDNNTVAIVHNIDGNKKVVEIEAQKILIATGGAENAINFDGWTLPGVMGAGAAQTMINVNRVLPGERVLMVGSGNVGLIVSYQLMQAGATVVGIVEGMEHIGGYAVHASKIKRAGVDFYLKHTVVKAEEKDGKVCGVIIGEIDDSWNIVKGSENFLDVDTICIAAGLRPLAELSKLANVEHATIASLGGVLPLHDKNMETSVKGIYVAGDIAGVEEANTAMDEGRLAGIAMAQQLGHIDENKGEELKDVIRDRLATLRLGQFGERRAKAKEEILTRRAKL